MMSISHWGMFEVYPPRMIVVPATLFSDSDIAQWKRPDGYIEIRHEWEVQGW